MSRLARFSTSAQSIFYVASGLNHFWHRQFYVHIMPDHYSHPEALVKLSGVAEVLGGIGLSIPAARRFSSLGLSLMLVIFLDVHIFMLRHPQRFLNLPRWMLWARLPLQVLLVACALQSGRKRNRSSEVQT